MAHSSGIFFRLLAFLTLAPTRPTSSQPASLSCSLRGLSARSLWSSVSNTSSRGRLFFFFLSFLRSDASVSLSSPAPLSLGDRWGSGVSWGLSVRWLAWRLITVETLGVKGRSDGMPASSDQRSPKTPHMQRRKRIRAALPSFHISSYLKKIRHWQSCKVRSCKVESPAKFKLMWQNARDKKSNR